MTSLIGALRISLGLETAAFETGAKRASAEVNALGDRMERAGHRVGQLAKGIAITGAAIASSAIIGKIKDMAREGLEYASSLGEQAVQLGVTTSELQRYRYIASQVGIEQGEMDKGLAFLTRTLGNLAEGAKAPAAALKRLGLDQAEIARVAKMTGGEALPLLIDKFSALESPTARAAIAADIFGSKMGGKFMTLLSGGREQIDELTKSYKMLGIEIDESGIAKADAAMDKMAATEMAMKARQAQIAVDHSDTILKFGEAWENTKIRLMDAAIKLTEFFEMADQKGQKFSDWVREFDKRMGIPSPSAMTDSIARNFSESWNRVEKFFSNLSDGSAAAGRWVSQMVTTIAGQITGRLDAVWESARKKIEAVKGWFFGLYDAVVGHSYIPDMVDGIAANMERLDKVMVAPARDAAKKAADAFKDLAADVQPLLDRLFPEARALLDYRKDLQTIDRARTGGVLSEADAKEAQIRAAGYGESTFLDQFLSGDSPLVNMEKIQTELRKLAGAANDNADRVDGATVRIAKSFKNMADETLDRLQSLTSAIQGGGFLDILGAVINFGMQLGSIGVFGKKVQTNLNAAPRADGGPISAGGLYLVGERGPELMVSGSSGRIVPNHALGGGNSYSFQGNLMTPEFWQMIQRGDMVAAQAGGEIAMRRSAYAGSRRVG